MTWFRAPVKSYFWAEVPNFGDAMAPLLLSRFADLKTGWDTISHARIVTVGSILEHVPPLWDGAILGSGKLREDSQLHLHTKTAKMFGVRGPLTARQCPKGTYAIGDPGLMVSELIDTRPDQLYDLGIVPHWSDEELVTRSEFSGGDGKWTVRVINPRGDPLNVIAEIARCQRIVTSSLHGVITADSFGIPRRIEPRGLPGVSAKTMFKFRDYSASIGVPLKTEEMTEVSRLAVADRRFELFDAYSDLGDWVRNRGWR